jgi:hypothetical protein
MGAGIPEGGSEAAMKTKCSHTTEHRVAKAASTGELKLMILPACNNGAARSESGRN